MNDQQTKKTSRLRGYFRYMNQYQKYKQLISDSRQLSGKSNCSSQLSPKRQSKSTLSSHKQPKLFQCLYQKSAKRQSYSILQQPESINNFQLPPINSKIGNSRGNKWQKYYNVHNMETIKISEQIIKLINNNQLKSKIKKRSAKQSESLF